MPNDLGIKRILMSIKKPQANAPVERVNQVILNILVLEDLSNKVLAYINPWSETLPAIAWVIRDSYYCTIQATP